MSEAGLNPDFHDFLDALLGAGAEFIVVGAHAMAVHGVPRATGDLDVWIRPTSENAIRVFEALIRFGAPLADHGVVFEDLARPGVVYQIGLPPRRIDLMTSISGLEFEEGWRGRVEVRVAGWLVPFLGRSELLRNKRASGRKRDVLDAELLERAAI